jgi:cobalamin biosynthesis Co2+ chelatase CbiK
MAFIRPSFMDSMSWEMAEVYGAITDQILINLARHFPYWKQGQPVPQSSFEYQASMLAQMGQVNAETIKIIKNGLTGANKALANVLEQAIIEAVKKSEPGLLKGVKAGILHPAGIPIVAPNQYRAFNLYYQQAAQKLNLVNTVMLESTKQAYQATVADVAARVQATQTALDIGAGEVVTGVSSWNQALTHSINRMKENGITGFIDHGGHHWSAEAYTSMDIRTTVANTARAAVWETNENFGNDLYLVSYHNGARPLCYPWQNKVISANDRSGVTYDLDGNEIEVIAQSSTSYGEAAGLFGINCKHYPTPFIPGVSLIRGEPQSKEDNDRAYAESQQQRALERKIREEKRDLAMLKAQGASPEQIKAQRAKIRQTDDDIDAFCEKTGRARRQNREGVYTQREFPDANTYDVKTFEQEQKKEIEQYFSSGGSQQGYTFGTMTPNEPITPVTPPTTPVVPVIQEQMPTNKNGEIIQFAEKMNGTEYNVTREQVAQLAAEFNTNLQNVKFGALTNHAAGDVDITGSTMRLSAPKRKEIIIHEFAHTLTNSSATKYGLNNDKEFWKEIRSIRTQYRKYIRANPTEYISAYAESDNSIDEFMAEGFALAYMRKNGIEVPFKYGKDTTYSELVLNVIQKYFGK